MREHLLWVEKYRPSVIGECILPSQLKKTLQDFVDKKEVPNLLLYSTKPGSGKTTSVRALMNELKFDFLFINASLETSIDVLRTKMQDFASTVSMTSSRKYIILDEADAIPMKNQMALRGFLEEFSINCGFIMTCNLPDKIIDPIKSRMVNLDFNFKSKDLPVLMGQFMKRCGTILDENEVKYEPAVLAELIKNYVPDFRRTLGELQRVSTSGTISSDILLEKETSLQNLIDNLKTKNFKDVRAWLEQNKDMDIGALYWKLYNELYNQLEPSSIPDAILILNEGQKFDGTVPNKILNLMATLVEIMGNCQWK